MCRFVCYQGQPITLSALLTEPANSLIHQSFHANERTEPLNGDGSGVAWYVPGSPAPGLFRSVSPAWSNQNLHEIARVTTSPRVLAHVRAATQEFSVTVSNCHPFRHGALTFMHNGDFGAFSRVRSLLLRSLSDDAFRLIRGTTDSEHFFALVVDEMGQARKPRMQSCEPVNGSVIVSSEPLSDDPGWEPVPVGSLVVVGEDLCIETRPVSA